MAHSFSVRRPFGRPTVSSESLAILTGLWLAITCNRPFWLAVTGSYDWGTPSAWFYGSTLFIALTCLHVLIALPLLSRRTTRPVLAVLVFVAAVASYYTGHYGVFLDPGMLRNALHSEPKEAADLIGGGLFVHLALVALPAWLLLIRVRIADRSLGRALLRRVVAVVGTFALFAIALLAAYPDLAPTMRNQPEARYLITPANLVYSATRLAVKSRRESAVARVPIGVDAVRHATAVPRRPVMLLLVVGETARAANWGLSGYARDTTPALRARNVINFADVTSCGTDTETSVPCLFAPVGRRDYDETRIRRSESLLHVLARTGIEVSWRDNQTGCKGVCDGFPFETIDTAGRPDCLPGRCLDEHLLDGLEQRFDSADRVVVLHMVGSHGPAYDNRYPAGQDVFRPICGQLDLRRCTDAQLVNSYDNSIRYTDRVLAQAIDLLAAHSQTHDVALLYVSDHGESLGEHRLYLHGVPWRIAPQEQRKVPMILWLSEGFRHRLALDEACLRRRAATPVAHDHVFHSVLGLLDVATSIHEPSLDVVTPCRRYDALVANRRD
ncbi:MAG: phosphoethanolamine transferase [Lautropia sp.]